MGGADDAGGRARLFVSDVGGGGDLVVVALRPRPALQVMTPDENVIVGRSIEARCRRDRHEESAA